MNIFTALLVVTLSIAFARSDSTSREPHCSCSKFYYEEQLLEKTVRLGVKYEQLEKSIQQIKAVLQTVAFSSKTVVDTSLQKDQVIVFSEVVSNHGSGYDPNTGMFTAPVGGTYLFTVHLCPDKQRNIHYCIVVDGVEVTKGHFYDHNTHLCGTASSIVVLQPSQKVWVKSQYTGDQLYRDIYRWNSFTGVLLHGKM